MNGVVLTEIFKALSHPSRVEILDYLKSGPMTTGDLSEKFEVSRFAVMKHLQILEDCGLVIVRRKGRTRFNYLNAVPLQEMHDRWVSKYQSKLAASLLNLKYEAENLDKGDRDMEKMKIDSFQIEQEITIEASRETVYKALTAEIDKWWTFRLGEKESKLSIDPKINGLFFEDWGNGQGAVWGTITYLKENEEIRLNGLLGMKGAVNSSYSYRLETVGNATFLKLSHDAVGLLEPHWEEAHKLGWNELLQQNLKTYIEKSEGL